MLIIHCADIHIGSSMEKMPKEKADLRKRELLNSFLGVIDFAEEKNVRAVIIAGDFFHKPKIPNSVKKEIIKKIISVPGIDFLYLKGNHDKNFDFSFNDENHLPKNLKFFDAQDDWKYFHYNNVCIAGIDILRQSGSGFYEKLRFDKNKINIAVMHGKKNEIKMELLKGKYIDYLALGDAHSPDIQDNRLDSRGIYAYSGCLEGCGFDEKGKKGFFLLDINNGNIKREFIPCSAREYKEINVDITNCVNYSEIINEIKKNTETINKENIIDAVLKGKYKADTQKEIINIEETLKKEYFFARVKDNSFLDMDSVDLNDGFSLKSEFVKLVIKSGLVQEQKDKIIEYGIKALSGEELDI